MKTLIEIFQEVLNKETPKKKKTSSPAFKIKPSMLGSPCMRKIYYSASGVEEDYGFDLSGKKRMKLGDAIHEMLHSTFKEAGITVPYVNPDGTPHRKFGFMAETEEFPLECPELFVKNGYIDEVMIIDGELWIGEYKSINLRGFQNLASAKTDHIIQAVTYWYIFNLHLADGKFSHLPQLQGFTKAKGVRWLYVNKDDTEFKEYTMTEGDVIFKQIVDRIMAVKHTHDTKTLPPKSPDFCQTCNWRDKCKNNFNIS